MAENQKIRITAGDTWRLQCLEWGSCVAGIMLMALSWKLWFPVTEFPMIPFFSLLVDAPILVDVALAMGMVVSLIVLPLSSFQIKASPLDGPRLREFCLWALLGCGVCLVCLNQHRLQPWVLHLGFILTILAFVNTQSRIASLRCLTIAIYIYSGISKLDYQFCHSIGSDIVSTLFSLFRMNAVDVLGDQVVWVALGLAFAEVLLGLLLCHSKSKRYGLWAATVFHLSLIVVLSPVGMGHQWPVIVWNVFFLFQTWLIFGGKLCEGKIADVSWLALLKTAKWPTALILGFAILFPATRWIGVCDHWPAWELYSPRNSRVELRIQQANGLEESLQVASNNLLKSQEIQFNRWSIEELGVPVYPQARFQFGVASALLQRNDIDLGFQCRILSESNRFTGAREILSLARMDEMERAVFKFRLNTQPRRASVQYAND